MALKAHNWQPFQPDHKQRIDAIRHIVYEYRNLMVAGHYSMRGLVPWRTNCDDAFLLGCRKLEDFLMKNDRSKLRRGNVYQELDDVLALDYLPPGAGRNWALPIWSAEWRGAMNKQLAHIAYTRDKGWNHLIWVPKLEAEFNKAWWDFRESVTDDDFNKEFDKQIQVCQAGLTNIVLRRR
jgi:hypothetical protein